jgi:hypothetical protein
MSTIDRIFCEDKENSCGLNGQSILNGQQKCMTDYSGLDHLSDKVCTFIR